MVREAIHAEKKVSAEAQVLSESRRPMVPAWLVL